MQWLRDVHLPDLEHWAKSAVIYGNEDSPDRIDCYDSQRPLIDDVPQIWLRKEEEDDEE